MDIKKSNLGCLEPEFIVGTDQGFLFDPGRADTVYVNLTLEKNECLFCMSLNGKPMNEVLQMKLR